MWKGILGENHYIRVLDRDNGKVVKDIRRRCNHVGIFDEICDDPDHILELCEQCDIIRVYVTTSGDVIVPYKACRPVAMCKGPDGTVLVVDKWKTVLRFEWLKEEKSLDFNPFTTEPLAISLLLESDNLGIIH